jgi:hypothetical protein
MTDFEYKKTLLIGVIIGASLTLLAFYMVKPSPETPPVTPKNNFAVVDRYEDRCNVVQWTDQHSATYKYFLDCK